MRIILTLFTTMALAGCAATGTQIQADCERSFSAIGDIVQCTRSTLVEKNPAKLQDAKAKLYLLRGEQLAADVAADRMNNLDARVAWQKLYVELWTPSPEENAAHMRLLGQMLQQQQRQAAESGYKIVTPPAATTTVCTSGPFLGQVRTECKTQ